MSINDYRTYKRSYYSEQNKNVLQQLQSTVDFELIYTGQYGPYIDIAIKACDMEILADQDAVVYITLNDKTLMRDRIEAIYEDQYISKLERYQKASYEYSELF